jgi:acetyl esterase/lipase
MRKRHRFRPAIEGAQPTPLESLESRQLLSAARANPHHNAHHQSAHAERARRREANGTNAVRTISGLNYSAGIQMDLYIPRGKAPAGGWPAVVAFPGGAWRWADRQDYAKDASRLARFGYVVAVADYVYSDGGRVWPANLESCRNAVRFVRSRADRFDIDPNRIVAMGASSGGHMANLLGTDPEFPRGSAQPPSRVSSDVQAVVSFYGPTDMFTLVNVAKTREVVLGYLGGSPDRAPDRYADASPLSHASADDPPTFIVHGERDTAVPYDQSLRLANALRAQGVPVRLILIKSAAHGFRIRTPNHDYLPDVLAFLKTVWDGDARQSDRFTEWTPASGQPMPVDPW